VTIISEFDTYLSCIFSVALDQDGFTAINTETRSVAVAQYCFVFGRFRVRLSAKRKVISTNMIFFSLVKKVLG
jgi:hypothetical protein